MKTVAAGVFKAKCLGLLDEVARGHETIVVTKRGKPVGRLVPVTGKVKALRTELKGSIVHEKDIVEPIPLTFEADK